MKLRQTLEKPVCGYWDGGSRSVFNWTIDGDVKKDKKGYYVRIVSWEANFWFCVARGKTEKLTLCNAKRHLKSITKVPSRFGYIDE